MVVKVWWFSSHGIPIRKKSPNFKQQIQGYWVDYPPSLFASKLEATIRGYGPSPGRRVFTFSKDIRKFQGQSTRVLGGLQLKDLQTPWFLLESKGGILYHAIPTHPKCHKKLRKEGVFAGAFFSKEGCSPWFILSEIPNNHLGCKENLQILG